MELSMVPGFALSAASHRSDSKSNEPKKNYKLVSTSHPAMSRCRELALVDATGPFPGHRGCQGSGTSLARTLLSPNHGERFHFLVPRKISR